MNKAYIILAHKNPLQLFRLISRLDDNHSIFFIHIDKRANINEFHSVISNKKKVILIPRENTHWGGMGLVKATLNGLKAVRKHSMFDAVILLSGQDYPIKRNEEINQFLNIHKEGKIFLEYTPLPDKKRWKETGGLYRVNKYYFGLRTHQKLAAKFINLMSTFTPPLRRKMPEGLKPYAGSQWWIMDAYAVDYILNYVSQNPGYTKFHKYTFAPDEVYFHTILMNSSDLKIKESINNCSLMHMNWLHHTSAHPELIRPKDVPDLLSSKNLFARKFEQENTTEIFDLIAKMLHEAVSFKNKTIG